MERGLVASLLSVNEVHSTSSYPHFDPDTFPLHTTAYESFEQGMGAFIPLHVRRLCERGAFLLTLAFSIELLTCLDGFDTPRSSRTRCLRLDHCGD